MLRTLCAQADLITPNITEACLLTGLEYRETHDDSYIRTLLERLLALGARTAILTGVRTEPGRVGVACMDAAGAVSQCSAPYVPAVFYGTGDLFASTCAGALTLGWSVHDAMELASAYVADTIAETRREPDARWYGVSFEATIPPTSPPHGAKEALPCRKLTARGRSAAISPCRSPCRSA